MAIVSRAFTRITVRGPLAISPFRTKHARSRSIHQVNASVVALSGCRVTANKFDDPLPSSIDQPCARSLTISLSIVRFEFQTFFTKIS